MRWLADENIPQALIRHRRARGDDVLAISDEASGIADQQVLKMARAHNRVLLTFDRDHGDLIFNRGQPPPPAVVFFRLPPPIPPTLIRLVDGLLAADASWLDGQFTTVTLTGVRQRKLTARD